MPLSWIAPIAAIGSALIGSDASRHAANTQADASQYAVDIGNKQYEQSRTDMEPWRREGGVAIGQLGKGTAPGGEFNRNFTLGDFIKDPGYQFRMDEGQRSLESSAASRGGVLSGPMLRELVKYGQDYGSGEFNNSYNRYNNDLTTRFNRLSSIAGTGQTATRDVANLGANNAASAGQTVMAGANSRASGYVGQANAFSGGMQSLGNFYQQQQMMDRLFPKTQTTPSTPAYQGASGNDLDQMYGYGG